jgi:hypothetical protein
LAGRQRYRLCQGDKEDRVEPQGRSADNSKQWYPFPPRLPLLYHGYSEARDEGGERVGRALLIVVVVIVVIALAYMFLSRGRRRR